MLYRFLADVVVLAHFIFALFSVFGGFCVLKWRRMAWIHVPVALWAVIVGTSYPKGICWVIQDDDVTHSGSDILQGADIMRIKWTAVLIVLIAVTMGFSIQARRADAMKRSVQIGIVSDGPSIRFPSNLALFQREILDLTSSEFDE
ncbi:MAG: DUF2784 domain-containing protein [Deltaproteobacteria bacterium]|nr:DUF2784 domain-containing protein [Deltaproteobacteria bacterium]